MQTLLDISQLIAGFGLVVAIIYAIFQFREAKDSREATYLSNVIASSPTTLRISMDMALKSINEGKLDYKTFKELSEAWQERLLGPINMFDMLGYLVSVQALRLQSVVNYFGENAVLTSWDQCEPLVTEMRKSIGPYVFAHFENLADRVEAYKQHRPDMRRRSK